MHLLRHGVLAATVGITGALVGSGLSALLAAELLGGVARLPALAPRDAPPQGAASARSVLAGALFEPPPPDRPGPPVGGDDPTARPCAEGWSLVGAVVDAARPERSLAAVHAPDGAAVLAPEASHAGLTLVSVAHAEARLRAEDGAECTLAMFVDAPPSPSRLAPTPETPTEAPGQPRVTRLAENHYRVDREAIARARSLHPGVRVLPEREGGELRGARLHGLRPGSPAHRAGARDGDRIRAIDGTPLTDPSVALAAYGRLMRGRPVRVTVERGGRTVELTYEIGSDATAPIAPGDAH